MMPDPHPNAQIKPYRFTCTTCGDRAPSEVTEEAVAWMLAHQCREMALVRDLPQMKPDTAYMEVPFCKSCRWWYTGKRSADNSQWKAYDKADARGWGVCALTISGDNEPECPWTLAFVVEGDDYCGATITAPDFGCTQWEAKP